MPWLSRLHPWASPWLAGPTMKAASLGKSIEEFAIGGAGDGNEAGDRASLAIADDDRRSPGDVPKVRAEPRAELADADDRFSAHVVTIAVVS